MDNSNRRRFLQNSALLTTGLVGLPLISSANQDLSLSEKENINVFGPRQGYTSQLSILVSMMDWMRRMVVYSVKHLSRRELDYLHDDNANTIGAMLMHLAATETYYQLNTFDAMEWGSWDDQIAGKWDTAMNLGDGARDAIKGHDIKYYLDVLKETREKTLSGFRDRDDDWLMTVDKKFPWGPTNNYCKWFHVCEHESNHNGQIKWLKSRVPA
ncbi:DUF664 domain-containing protein [Fulvivirgaceae bacterium BMA12]|uniref:DUF664 domain-containing protein n=1 Tax=Agaribacillus aureus TaxID=3051825 RepID=A0ABT8LHP9_9BACT|nr:DUF664 domain-containing protein [Fulvivirgaceae bacterium BMA12]